MSRLMVAGNRGSPASALRHSTIPGSTVMLIGVPRGGIGRQMKESHESTTPAPPAWDRFPLFLFIVWLAFATILGISPRQRADWWMEQIVVVGGLFILMITYRWFQFSRFSYLLGFLFLCLHTVGAHFTYSQVPYREWWEWITGTHPTSPHEGEIARNHFDRAVHFLYGLMLSRPWREVYYFAMRPRRDLWSQIMVVSFTMSTSLIYELLEWAAAVVWGGEAGIAFLGTQGDPWDAHKDMLLASLGSLIAVLCMKLRTLLTGSDPGRSWGEGRANHARHCPQTV